MESDKFNQKVKSKSDCHNKESTECGKESHEVHRRTQIIQKERRKFAQSIPLRLVTLTVIMVAC